MVNSQKIKGRMVERKITQAELAKAMNLSQPALNQKINNVRAFTLEEAVYLQEFLKIDNEDFKTYFFADSVA